MRKTFLGLCTQVPMPLSEGNGNPPVVPWETQLIVQALF